MQPEVIQMPYKSAIIGLGANLRSALGSPTKSLSAALNMIQKKDTVIQTVSRFYSTPCFPAGTGPDYVNATMILDTTLSAPDLLSRLHEVEDLIGRKRIYRWGERVIDLDLLSYEDEISPNLAVFKHWQSLPLDQQKKEAPQQLILPHPRIQDRAFVLVPLAEIAPDWIHPVFKRSTNELLAELDLEDVNQVIAI